MLNTARNTARSLFRSGDEPDAASAGKRAMLPDTKGLETRLSTRELREKTADIERQLKAAREELQLVIAERRVTKGAVLDREEASAIDIIRQRKAQGRAAVDAVAQKIADGSAVPDEEIQDMVRSTRTDNRYAVLTDRIFVLERAKALIERAFFARKWELDKPLVAEAQRRIAICVHAQGEALEAFIRALDAEEAILRKEANLRVAEAHVTQCFRTLGPAGAGQRIRHAVGAWFDRVRENGYNVSTRLSELRGRLTLSE